MIQQPIKKLERGKFVALPLTFLLTIFNEIYLFRQMRVCCTRMHIYKDVYFVHPWDRFALCAIKV